MTAPVSIELPEDKALVPSRPIYDQFTAFGQVHQCSPGSIYGHTDLPLQNRPGISFEQVPGQCSKRIA